MIPLAERLRPLTLCDFIGQEHLVGEGAVLRNNIISGEIPSMIFWGPPGVGKTTLANIISNHLKKPFFKLSAINSGVKDIRNIIDTAANSNENSILFIDEIHRFNKAQQDSLLAAVEKGIITLIGATTENPSFEVISPLLSRCQVYILNYLDINNLNLIVDRAIKEELLAKNKKIIVSEREALYRLSGGDARKLLNAFELVVNAESSPEIVITNDKVLKNIQQNLALYDKSGEQHYDIISAFIKSIRGSDPNAAVYWLARMITAGEDPKFIARRMLILASEDIGNANPNALLLANACFQAVNVIGYPEAEIILSHIVVYLSTSPKSNSTYQALMNAKNIINNTGDLSVPLHLRNAPTKLMKQLGYAKDYLYAHSFDNNFVNLEFLPDLIKGTKLYIPQKNQKEDEISAKLKFLWKDKYNY